MRKAFTILIAVLTLSAWNCYSQQSAPDSLSADGLPMLDYAAQKKYIINDIRIYGVKYLNTEILTASSGLQKGEEIIIPGNAISRALERLWDQRYFSDVKIVTDILPDDKVDIFLSETDYVFKYTDAAADVAMPLTDLGIDPDTDLADQYPFTKTTASDANGVQRGSTWQCCPGLLVYRRDIALDTFGTDDPVAIGEKVKDWDTFKASAEELKAKGYYALASYADTFRLYGNSISQPWGVEGSGTITVDPQIMQWVSDSKEWLDAGYLNKTVKGQFNDDWNKAMGSASKVFAFLLPAWGIDFTLAPNWDGPAGSWAVTNPPQEYNWGGSYIHACQGTDNPEHVRDIILALTATKDNLIKISKDYMDFTNTMSGMQEAATDDSFSSEFLGGQNAYEYFSPVAENIVIAPLSSYDQGCVELIQNAFSDYYQGNVDFDRAKENFETAIKERYPDITTVVWPD